MSDTEAAEDEAAFWTTPVYVGAVLLFLLRAPAILSTETTAGLIGSLLGGVIGALAVAGVVKLIIMALGRVFGYLDPR